MSVLRRTGAAAPAFVRSAVLSAVVGLSLGGCATIISGNSQKIAVNTSPPGATCNLMRGGEVIGSIPSTPGEATVDKTRADITIMCGRDGYYQASSIDRSGFEPTTFGNILAGGVIGVGVDIASGADNKYDSPVYLTLNPAPGLPAAGMPGPAALSQGVNPLFLTSSGPSGYAPGYVPTPLQPSEMPANPFR